MEFRVWSSGASLRKLLDELRSITSRTQKPGNILTRLIQGMDFFRLGPFGSQLEPLHDHTTKFPNVGNDHISIPKNWNGPHSIPKIGKDHISIPKIGMDHTLNLTEVGFGILWTILEPRNSQVAKRLFLVLTNTCNWDQTFSLLWKFILGFPHENKNSTIKESKRFWDYNI